MQNSKEKKMSYFQFDSVAHNSFEAPSVVQNQHQFVYLHDVRTNEIHFNCFGRNLYQKQKYCIE